MNTCKVEDEGLGNDEDPRKKNQKYAIRIKYRSKNMKWKLGESYQLFYVQDRKSLSPTFPLLTLFSYDFPMI